MDAVYPAQASALARGRRRRRQEPRARHRTMPVTFAEIKEVDEENEECVDGAGCAGGEGGEGGEGGAGSHVSLDRRRRPDILEERLGSQFTAFRRRRAKLSLREQSPPPSLPAISSPRLVPSSLHHKRRQTLELPT